MLTDAYIQNVLGLDPLLSESTGYRRKVIQEHRRFQRAMQLDEGFFDSIKSAGANFMKGAIKGPKTVMKFTKTLKTVLKDPKKIVILIDSLSVQIKDLFKKLYGFADIGVANLGFIRSIATHGKTLANKAFSGAIKGLEKLIAWFKKWTSLGLKKFKELKGWQKALLGISLIVGGHFLYKELKTGFESIFTAIAEAVAVWTDDNSVIEALKLTSDLGEGEEYEDPEYNKETHVMLRLKDGKPFIIEKKFWQSKELKAIGAAIVQTAGTLSYKAFQKFAIKSIAAAATGGLAPLINMMITSWKTAGLIGKVLGKSLDAFEKEEKKAQETVSEIRSYIRQVLIESFQTDIKER
jgi:hypothetical protein